MTHAPCIKCEKNRRIYAKGLCRPCYQANWVKTTGYKPPKKSGVCSGCFKWKEFAAKGECWTCYRKGLEAEKDD